MIFTPDAFLALGAQLSGKLTIEKRSSAEEFFKSTYGANHEVCSITWELLSVHKKKPCKASPKHLLWGLILLNTYATESFLAGICGVTPKTYRKWSWLMIDSINQLYSRVVSILNTSRVFMSVSAEQFSLLLLL